MNDINEWGMFEGHPAARSISDDDLCASCAILLYCPGQLSVCALATIEYRYEWPGMSNEDGYVVSCPAYGKCEPGSNLAETIRSE